MMSEGRALTNAIGNTVATLVIARWSGELDRERLRAVLDEPSLVEPDMELHHGGGPRGVTGAAPRPRSSLRAASVPDRRPRPGSRKLAGDGRTEHGPVRHGDGGVRRANSWSGCGFEGDLVAEGLEIPTELTRELGPVCNRDTPARMPTSPLTPGPCSQPAPTPSQPGN